MLIPLLNPRFTPLLWTARLDPCVVLDDSAVDPHLMRGQRRVNHAPSWWQLGNMWSASINGEHVVAMACFGCELTPIGLFAWFVFVYNQTKSVPRRTGTLMLSMRWTTIIVTGTRF